MAINLISEALAAFSRRVLTKAYVDRLLSQKNQLRARLFGLLLGEGLIKKIVFKNPYGGRTLFTLPGVTEIEIAQALMPRGFISHAAAAFMHGLLPQPSVIQINVEQSAKPPPSIPLTQEGIDRAFRRPSRTSQMVFRSAESSVQVISGKKSGRLGVESVNHGGALIEVTGLERTLIDLCVRPEYAGGAKQVLQAYRKAAGRANVGSLLKSLRNLNYVYPYHQAIGYYLSRAGFGSSNLLDLRTLGMKYEFYLEKGEPVSGYDASWQVHLPRGLK